MKEFDFREYIKKGFLEAIGKMADYKIRLNSSGYFDSGVLTAEDLAEIDAKINAQYPQVKEETEESVEGKVIADEVITDGVVEDEASVENSESESNNEPAVTESETEVIS